MKAFLNRFQVLPSPDPDDNRRRSLLNILLVGLMTIAVLLVVLIVFSLGLEGVSADELFLPLAGSVVFVLLALGIAALNHYRPGTLAAWFFLLVLLVAISFSDAPKEMVDGRSIYLFTLPILIASFVLFPLSSFVFAALSSLVVVFLTYYGELGLVNFFGMVGFFAIAFVAWLASRNMENALRDVRNLNRELDRRVEERTRELAEALAREVVETGKSQAILEGIADGVIVFDASQTMIVANPSVCRLLEADRADLLGKNIGEFSESQALSKEDSQKLQYWLAKPNETLLSGRLLWGQKTLSVTTAAVTTPVGLPIGTVAVFRDFTKEAEVEQMKNTFVAIVSHELRTPLNAILAYSEMLQGEVYGPVNPKQANAATRIYSNAQRLLGMVSDLLDQARLEAGKLKINVEEFPVAELADAVHGVMDKPARDKGLDLKISVEPGAPVTVWGDPHRSQQILINLVNNAVKFTEKGEVVVRIRKAGDTYWAIHVSDTGPGIPEKALPYIFETFRQADGVTTRQHGGVGLGLSIVKRLVELMGGTVTVSSQVKQGTTFVVTLPVKPSSTHKEEMES
jgi:signal transduction histidine kinase